MSHGIYYLTELVREQPYQLRLYPALSVIDVYTTLQEHDALPALEQERVDACAESIRIHGMRNPLIVEWFGPYSAGHLDPRWSARVGNNRVMALRSLGVKTCKALVIVPNGMDGPSGDYEVLSFMDALAQFDASHPWWHSYILRGYRPDLVPPAA